MNALHGKLEAVEGPGFWVLDFNKEPLSQVFDDNTITCSKECKNVFDEMFLIFIEFAFPVTQILLQIKFFSCPEACHMLLVHLPDIIMLDREHDKSLWICFK